jgi:2-keto-4-pentenoate hydratase/2-oxohepta-3-ene-1,7-dioic acid hydratase in catechol pathway
MRYLSFTGDDGNQRAGIILPDTPDEIVDVTDACRAGSGGPMRRLISMTAQGCPVEQLTAGARRLQRSGLTLLAPVPDPTKIVAAPVNYRNHQSEMSQDSHIDALGVFLKAPSSLAASGDVVRLPYTDRRFDQEGEFAAVIGRRARNISEDEALDHVFGFTSLLDMTMRGGEDRSVRKSFDTFTPVGPTIVSVDAAPDIDDMELHLSVNGVLRQRADLRGLIWSLPRLLAYASSVMTLEPGDIITTGTPEGVGQVFDGDHIALEITGLDPLEVSVSSEGAVICPTRGANRGPKPPQVLTPVAERTGAAT